MRRYLVLCVLALSLSLYPLAAVVSNASSSSLPSVVMMFDDAYLSHYSLCYPYLELSNVSMHATFNIAVLNVSDYIGARNTYETIETMRWGEIDKIDDAGHDIESHGLDDTTLTSTSTSLSMQDLIDAHNISQWEIEEYTGSKPYVFLPHGGATNDTVKSVTEDYYVIGFERGVSDYDTMFDVAASDLDLMSIPFFSGTGGGANPYWSVYGEWKNGSNTDIIKGNFTARLNWLVGNGSDYAFIFDIHEVFEDIGDCREAPYGDISYGLYKWVVDTLVEYRDVGKNLTVVTMDELFASQISKTRMSDSMFMLVGAMVAIAVMSMLTAKIRSGGK